jgi:predicted ATPase
MQNLASALIRNASAANEMDHIVFVTVDLVNRVKNDGLIDPKKRVVYASLNDEASRKALAVSDFTSAAKYCESGISFLGSNHWEKEHDLSIRLYTTSIAALYSCTDSNQDLLRERIDLVFQHARNVDEELCVNKQSKPDCTT